MKLSKPMSRQLLSGLLFTTVISPAVAEDVNGLRYGGLSVGYVNNSLEGQDGANRLVFEDFKGGFIAGEALIAKQFLVSFLYSSTESKNLKSNGVSLTPALETEASSGSASLGYRVQLRNGFDLIPQVTHSSVQSKLNRAGSAESRDSSSSTSLGGEMRASLFPSTELHFSASRDDEKTNRFGLTGLYRFHNHWGVRLGYARTSGTDDLSGGAVVIGVDYLF